MSLFDLVPDNLAIELTIAIFLGMLLGSFSTAVVYRTRHNQSWIWNNKRDDKARSFCPACGHTLGIKSLVPVFSWLFQKGRCCYCQAKIPSEYILIELTLIIVCLGIYALLGFTKLGVFMMFLSAFFVSQGLLAVKYKVLSKLLFSIIVFGGVFILLL